MRIEDSVRHVRTIKSFRLNTWRLFDTMLQKEKLDFAVLILNMFIITFTVIDKQFRFLRKYFIVVINT